MIQQYDRLWPDHPFVFRIPYQSLGGDVGARVEYIHSPESSPEDIPATMLRLLAGVDDDEWIYWCADDKYPITLSLDKVKRLMDYARISPEVSGLMFCRCRATLGCPDLALYPGEHKTPTGEILLERRAWYQIWLHQFLRAKVLRHFFLEMPPGIRTAKSMLSDPENEILKLADHRLFVTKENLAVYGESTHRGRITRNCYESMRSSNIALPEQFRHPIRQRITVGKL